MPLALVLLAVREAVREAALLPLALLVVDNRLVEARRLVVALGEVRFCARLARASSRSRRSSAALFVPPLRDLELARVLVLEAVRLMLLMTNAAERLALVGPARCDESPLVPWLMDRHREEAQGACQ